MDVKSIAVEYLKKFPETPSLTLAKMMYRDNKHIIKDIEQARCSIRYYRGSIGNKNRHENIGVKDFLQSEERSRSPFDLLPEGLKSFDDWSAIEVSGESTLILPDLHVPYHDSDAIHVAIDYGRKNKADTVILNGDIADFYSVSRFVKDPRKIDFEWELEVLKLLLIEIVQAFPKARIIYKVGNHEERFEIYMKVKAPEIYGCGWTSYDAITGAKDLGIEIIRDKRLIRIGKLNVIHGHEFGKSIFDPVNPARGFYMKGKECCLGSHLHRTSEHVETSMNGTVTGCWSTGCLCDLRPEYAPMNKWNHGFALVKQNEKGFTVQNKKIIDGEVF